MQSDKWFKTLADEDFPEPNELDLNYLWVLM